MHELKIGRKKIGLVKFKESSYNEIVGGVEQSDWSVIEPFSLKKLFNCSIFFKKAKPIP